MMLGTRSIDARLAGHGGQIPKRQLYVNNETTLYILKREVNLWKYSRAGKNYRVEKAVTS
jgi:hypothetical protein